MDEMSKINNISKETFSFWKNSYGWAPNHVAETLSIARLDWLEDLTETLKLWNDKSLTMTDGELLLAWTNMGALVEGWLKLFYCIYYDSYLQNPRIKRGDIINPNDLTFEDLIQFSRDKIWDGGSDWNIWVKDIQFKRNAIHAFNSREIGNGYEYSVALERYYNFIVMINDRLTYPN